MTAWWSASASDQSLSQPIAFVSAATRIISVTSFRIAAGVNGALASSVERSSRISRTM